MKLPALSESPLLRLSTVMAMYVAQGIQVGLLIVALPAYMAAQGVSLVAIGGFISALILPWTLKLLYAPLMERYTFLAMGRRRPWVIVGTLGAALGYFGMALVADPLSNLGLLTGVMVAGSLFLALQDVSTDALTIDVVPLREQPRANGLMWGGKVLGAAGTAAATGWLLNTVGMSATLVVAGCVTASFALIPILVRERPHERLLPWTRGEASEAAAAVQLESWAEIARSLGRVLFLPASLLGALAGFVMSTNQGFAEALGPGFTVQHLGWADTSFSNMIAVAGVVGGVVGMVAGGLLVRWLGRVRAIQAALFALVASGIAMGLGATLWSSDLAVQLFFMGSITVRTLATIAFFALCMALCWRPVAAAQFALYMAISNFGIAGGAALFGPLETALTYEQLFFVFALMPLVALAILHFVDLETHVARIDALNAKDLRVTHDLTLETPATS
jgi:PAT family beta-lactamase induction signal transducer AmpG